MIAIEIRVNGELKATCGAEDLSNIGASVSVGGRLGENSSSSEAPSYVVECSGWHKNTDNVPEVLKWVGATVSSKDEITFRFVETDTADLPIDRQVLPTENER